MKPIPIGSKENPNFSQVVADALRYLQENVGLGLWMVTRVAGEDWIVLEAADRTYGLKSPALFKWSDSFCSRMVLGRGPRIAPDSNAIPAYAEAPIGKQVEIGAYVGVPLINYDGSLFGTLCAIDPHPQPKSLHSSLPLVELIAGMLSGVLSAEIRATELWRRAEQAQIESETDALTGLFNRRGWDRLLSLEEARCRQYGHPACVMGIDLDGLKFVNDTRGHDAGDALIRQAGGALRAAVRKADIVARVGGDEFLVLGVECDAFDAEEICGRIREKLDRAGVSASLGMSNKLPSETLSAAVKEADRFMYLEKRRKKATRSGLKLAS